MRRHGRIRVSFRGHAESSYASLELPLEEVVGGLVDHMGVHEPGPRTLEIEGLYAHANDDVVRVTVERVAARVGAPLVPPKGPSIVVKRIVDYDTVRGVEGTVTVLENRVTELSVLASCGPGSVVWSPPMLTVRSLGIGLFREDVENFDRAVRVLFEEYARRFGTGPVPP
jgi:hypothetical protein